MKNLFITFLALVLSNAALAQDAENNSEVLGEDEYEDGCSNELDDDLDGNIDSDDSDCEDEGVLLLENFSDLEVEGVLVWGIGIALLSTVGGDSGTGTATTD